MSFYVIADPDSHTDLLDSPLLEVGLGGETTAVAIFSRKQNAKAFIQAMEWFDEGVAEIEPLQGLAWLIKAKDNLVDYLVLNPEPEVHAQRSSQRLLRLTNPYEVFSQVLRHHRLQVAFP